MKILLTAPYNDKAIQFLQENLGEVAYHPWKPNGRAFNEEELIALLRDNGAEALITEHDHVTEKVIASFPDLQFIGVCRGTPSNVAVAEASKLGIPVFFAPARNAQAVVEMFFSNVIALLRGTLPAIAWLESESWQAGSHDSYLQFKGNELAEKTIGIVGFGAIGRRIAELAAPYPARVLYYDPFVNEVTENASPASLESVFADSDIVSIHLPVNEHTKGMITGELIALMKPDAIFVNTSRAVVVDRAALLAVLEQKKIRGAVLDVFSSEPPDEIDYRMIHMPQVLATPHIAGATHEVEDHHARIMNDNLRHWLLDGDRKACALANRKAIEGA